MSRCRCLEHEVIQNQDNDDGVDRHAQKDHDIGKVLFLDELHDVWGSISLGPKPTGNYKCLCSAFYQGFPLHLHSFRRYLTS